ncbi:TetR/AcrR family transcriptional regulator [Kribbella pratensis]|uniref:TetR family transcriptional regulator n=1 Tax=Kribbella pratensis TaxID=2512112 RepID=A0A4R8BS87_9ACTN|nr:TetR/AcrR family transcriptional regulator [Kribbella pratensis]TDW60645.1 TetR family transcriptional regulator [Kribbella pratensis]
MVTRTEWLDAGLELLATEGAPAITIERLTDQLGVTKGSYYHHFGSAGGFKAALMEYFEAQYTTRLIDTIDAEDAKPRAKLEHLLRLVLADPDSAALEIAVRAWALQDPEVRAAQERVDEARTAYLKELCRGLGADVDPDRYAQLLYLILIGAEQVLPPVERTDLREIYNLTLRLID